MPFRIVDRRSSIDLMEEVEKEALKVEGTPWNRQQHTKRAKWLYQRAQLQLAKKLEVFHSIDYIDSAFVPQDETQVQEWFNDCNSRSVIPDNGARLDFGAPIKINLFLVQDLAL